MLIPIVLTKLSSEQTNEQTELQIYQRDRKHHLYNFVRGGNEDK